jgi:Leucine-rich repeat (LRR) protein
MDLSGGWKEEVGVLSSDLYEEEEQDGWEITTEVEGTVKSLDRSNSHWTILPVEIYHNAALTCLNLSHNQLLTIPEDIVFLSLLQELDLSYNRLYGGSVCLSLPRIQVLRLSYNSLKVTPPRLTTLTHLRVLHLDHTELCELPKGMGSLRSLEVLHLEHNFLKALVPDVFHLDNLKELYVCNNQIEALHHIVFPPNLQHLDLGDNALSFVHPSQFSVCSELKFLRLSANRICFLDEEMFLNQLHSLEVLHLAGNNIREIPFSIGALPRLHILNLGSNSMTELPVSFGHLVELRSLYLCSNYLLYLPRSIGNLRALEYIDVSCES